MRVQYLLANGYSQDELDRMKDYTINYEFAVLVHKNGDQSMFR